jgi:hypothetical protein
MCANSQKELYNVHIPDGTGQKRRKEMFETGTNVLVCDSIRGVYFGTLATKFTGDENSVYLHNARHAFNFDTTTGVYELSTKGPGKYAKVGPVMKKFIVRNVSNVAECEEAAVKAWNKAAWAK